MLRNASSLGRSPYGANDLDCQSSRAAKRWPQRHRAAKACTLCRSRKIRCDVVLRHPNSCTNCDLDGIECVITPSRRRRTENRNHLEARPLTNINTETTDANNSRDDDGVKNVQLPQSDLSPLSSGLNDITFSGDLNLAAHFDMLTQSSNLLTEEYTHANGSDGLSSNGSSSIESNNLNGILDENDWMADGTSNRVALENNQAFMYPTLDLGLPPLGDDERRFVAPYPWIQDWNAQQVSSKSWAELLSTNVLSLPNLLTIEKLLRCYFVFLHPTFPIISESDFYLLIHQKIAPKDESSLRPINLSLLNSIMFAASSYISTQEVKEAGFPSIRQMRSAFFRRAKVLYELDCQTDDLGRVEICVLLSFQRSYLNKTIDNEYWILKALDNLKNANIRRIIKANDPSGARWKRVYCCWAMRAVGLIVGLKTISQPHIISISTLNFNLSDMEQDLNFDWFISSETKRDLARRFIARVALAFTSIPLCKLLLKRNITHTPGSSDRETTCNNTGPKSILSDIEESEGLFENWKKENVDLFSSSAEGSKLDMDVVASKIHHANFILTYEYTISTLHQTSLSFDRASTSKWANMMREPSRNALLESAEATMKIINELASQNLVEYLPITAILFIFIPFTLHHLTLKSSICCSNTAILHDLTTCVTSLQILTERYEVSDFFLRLLNASLAVAHRYIAQNSPLTTAKTQLLSFDINNNAAKHITIPEADILRVVIRFQDLSLVKGVIDEDEIFI